MTKVEFSELANRGIQKEFPERFRQESCRSSMAFYLRKHHDSHSEICEAFGDKQMYLYIFGLRWRVLYEVTPTRVLVWSFVPRLLGE